MILLPMLTLALQGQAPPPVIVDAVRAEPVPAIAWSCTLSGRAGLSFTLSGTFPAVSVEAQEHGGAFRLQSTIKSSQAPFNGTFPAALTSPLPFARHYSIAIGDLGGTAPAYIISFQFYPKSHDGFAAVTTAGASAESAPAAYAAGLCETRDER